MNKEDITKYIETDTLIYDRARKIIEAHQKKGLININLNNYSLDSVDVEEDETTINYTTYGAYSSCDNDSITIPTKYLYEDYNEYLDNKKIIQDQKNQKYREEQEQEKIEKEKKLLKELREKYEL
jgi:hypothetical protein